MSDKSMDVYATKLPELEKERRHELELQQVSSKQIVKDSILTVIPVLGAVCLGIVLLKSKCKTRRKYAVGKIIINILFSVLIINSLAMMYLLNDGLVRTYEGSDLVQEDSTEQKEVQTEEVTEAATDKQEEGVTDSFTYDSTTEKFTYYVNGVQMTFSSSSLSTWKENNWQSTGTSPNPNKTTQMIASMYDSNGSTALLYFDTQNGDTGKLVKINLTFISGSTTTMMGLDSCTDYDMVSKIFTGYDSVNKTEYKESTNTGTVKYQYGKYYVSVSLKNNAVSSIILEESD